MHSSISSISGPASNRSPARELPVDVIDVVRGDITAIPAAAIVNAAQSSLLGGGGVDGAIHAAAGPSLLAECREVRRRDLPDGLPPGEAVVTGAGDLPARFVIHTVGPKFWEYPDGGVHVLARSHTSSMAAAWSGDASPFPPSPGCKPGSSQRCTDRDAGRPRIAATSAGSARGDVCLVQRRGLRRLSTSLRRGMTPSHPREQRECDESPCPCSPP